MKKVLLFSFLLSILILCVLPHQVSAASPLSYPENHCLSFDGTDDYLSCSSPDVEVYKVGKLTVELWIRPKYTMEAGSDAAYGHKTGAIISYTETWCGFGGWALYFDFSDGYLWFRYNYWPHGAPYVETVSTNRRVWNAGSWCHIAVTYDPSYIVFYVNGTVDRIHTYVRTLYYESANLKIGGHPTYGYMFNGLIDEVRVWNISRTQSEILSTWTRVLNSTECAQPELIGYWRFDEGSGDISEDYSAQDYDAMLALAPYNPTWVDFGAPIIPEFPSAILVPLFIIISTIALVFTKNKLSRKTET